MTMSDSRIQVVDRLALDAAATGRAACPGGDVRKLQVTIQPAEADGATTGTVALYVTARGARYEEPLLDSTGTPVTILLAANTSTTYMFDATAGEVVAVPDSADGDWDLLTTWY